MANLKKLINYNNFQLSEYIYYLSKLSALSKLFSDSEVPLLSYRATEILYCKAFDADNLSRSDISIDARYKNIGVGIKTFVESKNFKTYQKVAEFNKSLSIYKDLSDAEKIKKIAELRNIRLEFVLNSYNVDELIYHIIARDTNSIKFHEETMDFISIDKIDCIENKGNSIYFTDGKSNYLFNSSKSTLYKQFDTSEYLAKNKIEILDDPFTALNDLNVSVYEPTILEEAIIPLYSRKIGGSKFIPEHSGLNQWNANGRKRDYNEVYIPYNKHTREITENFFPSRKNSFKVKLPDGKIMKMKICQSDGKAIMSDPNKDLGKWLLRDILKLKEGELCTYDHLNKIGIDSVLFTKYKDFYTLDFKNLGSYEDFENKYLD